MNKENLHFLQLLCDVKLPRKVKKLVLQKAPLSLIADICDCAFNILTKRFPISDQLKIKLKTHREFLYKIASIRSLSLSKKRSIIAEHCAILHKFLSPIVCAQVADLKRAHVRTELQV